MIKLSFYFLQERGRPAQLVPHWAEIPGSGIPILVSGMISWIHVRHFNHPSLHCPGHFLNFSEWKWHETHLCTISFATIIHDKPMLQDDAHLDISWQPVRMDNVTKFDNRIGQCIWINILYLTSQYPTLCIQFGTCMLLGTILDLGQFNHLYSLIPTHQCYCSYL